MSAFDPSPEFTGTRFDEVVQQMPAAVMVVDARSQGVLYANARARQMTEQDLGRTMPPELTEDWEIFHPDGRPYAFEEWPLVRSITTGEQVSDEEYFNVRSDGTRMIVRCSSAPIYDEERSIVAGVLVMTDVTQEKRHEERLSYLAGLLDNTEDAVVAMDAEWFITVWNKGAERLYGWSAEEVLGRHTLEVARVEMSQEERTEVRLAVVERGRWRGEVIAYRRDGEPVWVELITVALRGADDELTGYLGIHRDIGDRKRAEEALHEAQRGSETILESITDAFVAVDQDWRYTYVNDRALARMRATKGASLGRADVIGRSMWEMFREAIGTEVERRYRLAMRERRAIAFETYFEYTGEWIEAHVYPSQGGLAIYYSDVSERRRTEEALRDARERTEAILESITDEFVALDHHWRYTYVNERALAQARRQTGRDVTAADFLGRTLWEQYPQLVGTIVDHELRRALREQAVVEFEVRSPITGRWVQGRVYPSPDGVSVYHHDISARKAAAEEMSRRAEQQELVAGLGRRALASDDLESLLDEAVGLVARTLDVELTGVAEIVHGGEEVVFRAGYGWREGVVGGRIEEVGPDSLLGWTLGAGEPVLVEDMGTQRRVALGSVARDHGVVSALTVMIESPDEPFGALGALSTRRRSFSPPEVSFMQSVANVLASAVERRRAQERRIEVREMERRRIARDLHDDALQDLTHALALADHLAADGRPDGLSAALERVGEHLRGAIYDLRLGGERDSPFGQLLETLVAAHRAKAVGYEIELDVRDGVPAGPLGATGIELLRILGEALTNARRHARAARVRVRVWGSGGTLHAEVSDDGHGFDPDGRAARAAGDGIRGMRERAELIHGRLDILSEPAAGTTVRLQAPLHPLHDAREQEREERQAIDSLTAREREVLQALGAGLDSQEIANELHISIRTERNHVARILAKLGVHSQLQAVLVGLRYGLIDNGRESQPLRSADTRP